MGAGIPCRCSWHSLRSDGRNNDSSRTACPADLPLLQPPIRRPAPSAPVQLVQQRNLLLGALQLRVLRDRQPKQLLAGAVAVPLALAHLRGGARQAGGQAAGEERRQWRGSAGAGWRTAALPATAAQVAPAPGSQCACHLVPAASPWTPKPYAPQTAAGTCAGARWHPWGPAPSPWARWPPSRRGRPPRPPQTRARPAAACA